AADEQSWQADANGFHYEIERRQVKSRPWWLWIHDSSGMVDYKCKSVEEGKAIAQEHHDDHRDDEKEECSWEEQGDNLIMTTAWGSLRIEEIAGNRFKLYAKIGVHETCRGT